MKHSFITLSLVGVVCASGLYGCATESSRVIAAPTVKAATVNFVGEKTVIAVGKFDNRSNFLRGAFSDGVDRLGGQARITLVSHLQQSQRFNLMDRDNLSEVKQEAQIKGQSVVLQGAPFIVTGDVVEFGRKEVGDKQLFGLFGRGKSQIAYAKVTLNVLNTANAQVVFSASGVGEYALSNREVLGFGGTADYDTTLNGKVLDLAIREAVDQLVAGVDAGQWGPAK